ncbi:MAG: carbonic anhydrase [Roseitalea porphyridii]
MERTRIETDGLDRMQDDDILQQHGYPFPLRKNALSIIAPDEEMLDTGTECANSLKRNLRIQMKTARPLPSYLVQRYHGWRATTFSENHAWYKRLASEGQRPRAMIVSCCDSRVHVTSIFGADSGEFFIHRNIANLVPPYEADGEPHGTSAAVEYAVTSLKVAHLIVIGHSNCGGVMGCHAMCSGKAPELEERSSFVGRWMDILRPGYERVAGVGDEKDQIKALEMQAVLISLENLMTFPFVREAVDNDELTIHGLWTDIGEGGLLQYDSDKDAFQPV